MIKKNTILFLFFMLFFGKSLLAETDVKNRMISYTVSQMDSLKEGSETNSKKRKRVKYKRGKAILFTIFTGILGGHRVYLGTHQRTPILYSVTLGGLGILPLIDLVHIIFTKDLSKYKNVSQIIMWGRS